MKAWYKSKTMWFNIISGFLVTLESYVGLLGSHFSQAEMQVIVGFIVIGNLILRTVTTKAISAT